MKLFLGTFTHALDAKNRVSVPRKLLDVLQALEGREEVALTVGFEHCLYLYPPAEFDRLAEAITSGSLGDETARDLGRSWFGQAEVCPIDKHGRLLIPDGLKRAAGLTQRVVFVGAGKRVELWGPDAWDLHAPTAQANYARHAREVLG